MSKNTIPIRANEKFIKEIRDMQLNRIKLGKDSPLKPINTSRITLALTRHKFFPLIKQDIIDADLK